MPQRRQRALRANAIMSRPNRARGTGASSVLLQNCSFPGGGGSPKKHIEWAVGGWPSQFSKLNPEVQMSAEQVHNHLTEAAEWYSERAPRCATVGYKLHGGCYVTDVLLLSNTALPHYHLTLN